jgi:hypothetical protein
MSDYVTVVSVLSRPGTSAAMQMLDAGGVEAPTGRTTPRETRQCP